MKLVARSATILLAAGISIILVANYCLRVSENGRSWGIIEELVWGRPLLDLLAPPLSENAKKWDVAANASHKATTLLSTHGISRLTEDEALSQQRAQAAKESKLAYENAIEIPHKYLEEINKELPDMYSHFISGMDTIYAGLLTQDMKQVRKGVSDYNKFIEWMQRRESSDFKKLK